MFKTQLKIAGVLLLIDSVVLVALWAMALGLVSFSWIILTIGALSLTFDFIAGMARYTRIKRIIGNMQGVLK